MKPPIVRVLLLDAQELVVGVPVKVLSCVRDQSGRVEMATWLKLHDLCFPNLLDDDLRLVHGVHVTLLDCVLVRCLSASTLRPVMLALPLSTLGLCWLLSLV